MISHWFLAMQRIRADRRKAARTHSRSRVS